MTKERIIELLVVNLTPFVLTALVALVAWGGRALKKKFEADGKISLMEGVALKLFSVADAVVRNVEATTKRGLEEKAKDGLSAEDYKALRDEAIAAVKAGLGEAGLAELKKTFGLATEAAVDTHIGGVVERAVAGVVSKKEAPADAPFAKLPGGLP